MAMSQVPSRSVRVTLPGVGFSYQPQWRSARGAFAAMAGDRTGADSSTAARAQIDEWRMDIIKPVASREHIASRRATAGNRKRHGPCVVFAAYCQGNRAGVRDTKGKADMSFGWTLAGTILQLMLANFLFMLVAFSGGGLANGGALGKRPLGVLNLSLFLLPASCVLSACIVIFLHWRGGGAMSYAWYALPLVATVFYVAYVTALSRRHRS